MQQMRILFAVDQLTNPAACHRSQPQKNIFSKAKPFVSDTSIQNVPLKILTMKLAAPLARTGSMFARSSECSNTVRQGRLRTRALIEAEALKFNSEKQGGHRRSRPLHAHVRLAAVDLYRYHPIAKLHLPYIIRKFQANSC